MKKIFLFLLLFPTLKNFVAPLKPISEIDIQKWKRHALESIVNDKLK